MPNGDREIIYSLLADETLNSEILLEEAIVANRDMAKEVLKIFLINNPKEL
ncbi:MAG: hypothetical protein QXL82_02070 [Candidatus Aenigmatarchaeota archaeon]